MWEHFKLTVPAPYLEPLLCLFLGADEGSPLKPLSVPALPRYKYTICLQRYVLLTFWGGFPPASYPVALAKLPTRGKPWPRTGGQRDRDRGQRDREDSEHSPCYVTAPQPILGGSGPPLTWTGAALQQADTLSPPPKSPWAIPSTGFGKKGVRKPVRGRRARSHPCGGGCQASRTPLPRLCCQEVQLQCK